MDNQGFYFFTFLIFCLNSFANLLNGLLTLSIGDANIWLLTNLAMDAEGISTKVTLFVHRTYWKSGSFY